MGAHVASRRWGMDPNFTMASCASMVEIWKASPGTRRPHRALGHLGWDGDVCYNVGDPDSRAFSHFSHVHV